jgi:hypothetical protein
MVTIYIVQGDYSNNVCVRACMCVMVENACLELSLRILRWSFSQKYHDPVFIQKAWLSYSTVTFLNWCIFTYYFPNELEIRYGKILLIWLTQDCIGSELLNVSDYQTVPMLYSAVNR